MKPVIFNNTVLQDGRQLVELGSDSICIEDMPGLLTPRVTFELVKSIKQRQSIPRLMHAAAAKT